MGEIVLVRHGQANSEAKNEADYDRLSALGHAQAQWLGGWIAAHEGQFDTVLSGTLRRHRETADGMGFAGAAADARLNEMDYFNLGQALAAAQGVPMPDQDGFAEHMPKVMRAWQAAEIQGQESFAAFEARVTTVLNEAAEDGRRVLCVTSGGVIGMALRHVLGLDLDRMSHVVVPIINTSIHRFRIRRGAMLVAQFNAAPHLDGRPEARTHY